MPVVFICSYFYIDYKNFLYILNICVYNLVLIIKFRNYYLNAVIALVNLNTFVETFWQAPNLYPSGRTLELTQGSQ